MFAIFDIFYYCGCQDLHDNSLQYIILKPHHGLRAAYELMDYMMDWFGNGPKDIRKCAPAGPPGATVLFSRQNFPKVLNIKTEGKKLKSFDIWVKFIREALNEIAAKDSAAADQIRRTVRDSMDAKINDALSGFKGLSSDEDHFFQWIRAGRTAFEYLSTEDMEEVWIAALLHEKAHHNQRRAGFLAVHQRFTGQPCHARTLNATTPGESGPELYLPISLLYFHAFVMSSFPWHIMMGCGFILRCALVAREVEQFIFFTKNNAHSHILPAQ
ncbi:unnamed protein product [Amoebophrya sp. A120]|nr:unnamed protein product [Amoebophrya sp. A120]|eukprot:GSA120T00026085001.1